MSTIDPSAGDGAFYLSRSFAAPRDLVWRAYAEADRLKQWWGPKGCDLGVSRLEFRPGGFFHYSMTYPGKPPMWGRFLYREISAPERMAFIVSFSNEGCGVARAPFSEEFPFEVESVSEFSEKDGGTTVSMRNIPHGASETEHAFYRTMYGSMQNGYNATLDQLEAYLAQGD